MPLRRRGGSGTGGGGLLFRTPPDEFTAATRAAAETARDAAITDTTPFDDNPSLAITLNWPATPTSTVWQVRRSSSWADVTPAIRGPMGLMGDQARFTVSQFRAVASNAIPTTAPTGGSYVQSTGVLTSSTGWSTTRPTPATGQVVVQSDAPINPATDADTVTPTWSVPFEPLDEGVALRTEAAETDAETAQAAAETALAAALVAQAAAEAAETNAETAETGAEAAQSVAENARDAAETALASSGAALAFNDFWTGDIDITTANQWKAVGANAVPANATWLLWNGGAATDGANDGPSAEYVWINAAKWRDLTADTVDTTPGDGTGTPIVEWFNLDVGDGTPDFARRDLVLGRTAADVPLLTSTDASEDLYGATLLYVTQAVAEAPGGLTESQVNTLIQTALEAAVTGNTETGITVTYNSDGTFDFVVSADAADSHDNFFGWSADRVIAADDFPLAMQSDTASGVLPAQADDAYLWFGRLASLPDPTTLEYSSNPNSNQINSYQKLPDAVNYNSTSYNIWVTYVPQDASFAGDTVMLGGFA